MKSCLFSAEMFYDEKNEFCIFSLAKVNSTRDIVLQFVREGVEQFLIISLEAKSVGMVSGPVFFLPEVTFSPLCAISRSELLLELFSRECTVYLLTLIPIDCLVGILSNVNRKIIIKGADGYLAALDVFCLPIKAMTGIDINPSKLPMRGPRFEDGKSGFLHCSVM